MKPPVRYLVPPGLPDKDLPPEVRAGLRLCVRLAERVARKRALAEQEKPGTESDDLEMI